MRLVCQNSSTLLAPIYQFLPCTHFMQAREVHQAVFRGNNYVSRCGDSKDDGLASGTGKASSGESGPSTSTVGESESTGDEQSMDDFDLEGTYFINYIDVLQCVSMFCIFPSADDEPLCIAISRVLPDGSRVFSCPQCTFTSASLSKCERHCRTHPLTKPFSCKICPFACSRIDVFARHERLHDNFPAARLKSCTYCSYTAARTDLLKAHLSSHTGAKPYQCRFCDFTSGA